MWPMGHIPLCPDPGLPGFDPRDGQLDEHRTIRPIEHLAGCLTLEGRVGHDLVVLVHVEVPVVF